jgi:hypothetical protein
MSFHRGQRGQSIENGLDQLIRCILYDSVADAEPSPQVWERIQKRILDEKPAAKKSVFGRYKTLFHSLWIDWSAGASISVPANTDPRVAWQPRLYFFDISAPLSFVRMFEGKMLVLCMA